ncbi:hypothetical protein EVAR_73350_1 [Eumeta japonica]|uniref:Uncharacterized protein n=1 Tax=Eumeta variegata TaxID=151549 RepID=A0A4C1SC29_EUMVA|nr:hypothetical protein EVAR_73350_1 [Eumeta japonica]
MPHFPAEVHLLRCPHISKAPFEYSLILLTCKRTDGNGSRNISAWAWITLVCSLVRPPPSSVKYGSYKVLHLPLENYAFQPALKPPHHDKIVIPARDVVLYYIREIA